MKYDAREILASWLDIFDLHEKQRRFVFSKRRNALYCGGIGSGKSWALINALLRASFLSPPGVTVGIFGRTGPDLTNVLLPVFHAQLEIFKDKTGIDPIKSVNKSERRYRMAWGSDFLARPYDRIDTIRGLTLGAAGVDEIDVARVSADEAFSVISGRVRDPRAHHKRLFLCTTPNGLQGACALWVRQAAKERELSKLSDLKGCDDGRCGVCQMCELLAAKDFYTVHSTLYDNPYLDEATKRQMRAGCSKRQALQEIYGQILRPLEVVFAEYSEEKDGHLIDHTWNPSLPYALGIDWGTTHGYFCAVQFNPKDGTWIVADEKVLNDVSRQDMRSSISSFIESRGRAPYWIGADRAVPDENKWARMTYQDTFVRTCRTKAAQSIISGVEALRYMLSPYDAESQKEMPPRLYFARSLRSDPTTEKGRGIRDSLKFYSYEKIMGQVTNTPSRSPIDPNKHAIDALRYLIFTSRREPYMHGGGTLPWFETHAAHLEYGGRNVKE